MYIQPVMTVILPMSAPQFQKMLKQYQQSLSFLELIVPAVITQLPMHAAFDFTHLKQLVEKQEEYLMGYAILQQLLKVSELVVVKECMRTLYQIQLWGKQLSHVLQMQQHDKTITQYACSFMQAIEKQDYTTAAQSAYALFHAANYSYNNLAACSSYKMRHF